MENNESDIDTNDFIGPVHVRIDRSNCYTSGQGAVRGLYEVEREEEE
jgi:hypothetical protein